MTHRVEFEGAALVQLNGLPSPAFDALVERVAALVQGPWEPTSWHLETTRRTAAIFGEGYVLLSFYVDDAAELIRIFDIAWIGLPTTPSTSVALCNEERQRIRAEPG